MEKGRIEITPGLISGLVAVTVSTYFLITRRDDFSIVAASIYFTLACTTDTYKTKIPNLLNASLLVAGISMSITAMGMQGFLLSVSGMSLGIALLLLPYIMGGMGAGDVKALGALGALVGPYDLLHIFVYTGLYGVGLGLLHHIFQTGFKETLRKSWFSIHTLIMTRDACLSVPPKTAASKMSTRFPYATAIAFGYYSFVAWGGVF